MRRDLLITLLVAASLAVACGSSNKNKPATVTTPATPIVGALASSSPAPTAASLTATPAATGAARTSTPSASFGAARVTSPTPGVSSTPAAASPAASSAATTASPAPRSASAAPATGSATPAAAPPVAPSAAAAAAASATSASGSTTVSTGVDARTLIDQVKLTQDDLPSGYTLGQLFGYQPNQSAATGYADPSAVLALLSSTGRQDGYFQQESGSSGGLTDSVQVWATADGAKQFMDQHPVPDSSVTFQKVDLAQPLGDQDFALKITANGGAIYALSWRRGRLVLGMGGPAGPDGGPSADLLMLASILDQKAQAAQQ